MSIEDGGIAAAVDESLQADETPVVETPVADEALTADGHDLAPLREEPKKELTMEDTIRAKFRELAKAEEPPKDAEGKPLVRDAKTGKFVAAPKGKEGSTAADAGAVVPAVALDLAAKAAAEAEAARVAAEAARPKDPKAVDTTKAPTSWKGPAQAKWAKLDPEIQAEVHRREADFHRGIQSYQELAGVGKAHRELFTPYLPMIRAAGTTPAALMQNWLNTEHKLAAATAEGKVQLMVQYAKAYGIDLTALKTHAEKVAAGLPVVPAVDPAVQNLQNQIAQLTQHARQQQEAAVQREYSGVVNEAKNFGAGKPHYEAVRVKMAQLIESGQANDFQDAYDNAIWLVPEVRAKVLAEQQASERKLVADKAAIARKAASTNVATRGTLPRAPVIGTMDDTIRAKLRELNGA